MSFVNCIMLRSVVTTTAALFCCSLAFAQQSVTGSVVDEFGEPLTGVNIVEKGTTNGALTDIDGNFSINVANGKTLVFSYIGYVSQEVVASGKPINLVLREDNQVLDETIVVGYGSVKKSNLTSSVSKISSSAMEDRPITQVGDAFQGQLAGVQAQAANGGAPGQELTIRIRGVNTITGDTSPLYVIDGVPRDNMSDINPSDIESVQILKDASATSIYGSRGANGVVLIQTKTGKGKPSVTFNAYFGAQTPEKYLDNMSGEEWVANNMINRNWVYLHSGGSMTDPMSARPAAQQIPSWWSTFTDFTDWQREVLRTAQFQNYEASASAASDMGSIYLSVGYQDQEGTLLNSDYTRLNMRLNATLNILDNLRVGMNLSYANALQNAGGLNNAADRQGKDSDMHHALMQSPLIRVGDAVRSAEYPSMNVNTAEYGACWVDPKLGLENTTDRYKKNRAQASIWGEWDIVKGLTFKTQYSRTYDGTQWEFFQPDWINRSSYKNTGRSSQTNIQDWTIQNTLTWDKTFGKSHMNVLLGQSAEKEDYYVADLESSGWAYNTLETLNLASTPEKASTERTAYTNASFFGRITYDYAEKYLASVSVRRDGSSRFGSNTKWGTFPSGSIGWKINQEEFMSDVEWINLLKLRASFGVSGNDRIGDYEYAAQLGTFNSTIGGVVNSGAAASNIANPDLKWETTQSLDFGFDLSAWHNRVQFNFDYYINTTKDLLYYVQTPKTTGFSQYLTNLGKIQNSGWEIDVTTHNIVKKNFKWDSALNLSHNSNEVKDLGGDEYYQPSPLNGQYFRSYVGGPVSQFYVYRTDGILTADCFDASGNATVPIYNGQVEGNPRYVDQNNDGRITEADMVAYGTNLPDLTWGFTNTFMYKGFTLSVLLQGQFGGDILNLGARHNDDNWSGNGRTLLKHWLHQYRTAEQNAAMAESTVAAYLSAHGIDTSWDGWTANVWEGWSTGNDDRRIYDATYVRIKNITLSYTFNKNLLKKAHISGLKIYGSVDNVYTFTDYVGYTPETSSYGSGSEIMGVDYATYPLSRKFTVGINLAF